jgi:hypothetical protein
MKGDENSTLKSYAFGKRTIAHKVRSTPPAVSRLPG